MVCEEVEGKMAVQESKIKNQDCKAMYSSLLIHCVVAQLDMHMGMTGVDVGVMVV